MFAASLSVHSSGVHTAGAGVGKTQLVKGKLASLPEDLMSLSISFNYFTDVVSFQKVGCQLRSHLCTLSGCWIALPVSEGKAVYILAR